MEKNNISIASSKAQKSVESIPVPATGKLVIPMTNDYLFRALLEKSNVVLCEMIRDLLHLGASETVKATIKNPVQPGQTVDEPEFFASYRMMNEKSYSWYGDKLCVKVLDLNRTDLATDEDKYYKIDYWARLFKATSWEEIHMLTENKPIITEAAKTVYSLTQDEEFRLRCEAREDYYRTQNDVKHYYEREMDEMQKVHEQELAEKDKTLAEKDKLIAEMQAKLKGK